MHFIRLKRAEGKSSPPNPLEARESLQRLEDLLMRSTSKLH